MGGLGPGQANPAAQASSTAIPSSWVDTMTSTHGHRRRTARVRHEVRDGFVVIAFSAAASTGVALALLLLVRVAG